MRRKSWRSWSLKTGNLTPTFVFNLSVRQCAIKSTQNFNSIVQKENFCIRFGIFTGFSCIEHLVLWNWTAQSADVSGVTQCSCFLWGAQQMKHLLLSLILKIHLKCNTDSIQCTLSTEHSWVCYWAQMSVTHLRGSKRYLFCCQSKSRKFWQEKCNKHLLFVSFTWRVVPLPHLFQKMQRFKSQRDRKGV